MLPAQRRWTLDLREVAPCVLSALGRREAVYRRAWMGSHCSCTYNGSHQRQNQHNTNDQFLGQAFSHSRIFVLQSLKSEHFSECLLWKVWTSCVAAMALNRTYCTYAAVGEYTWVFVADNRKNILCCQGRCLFDDICTAKYFLMPAQDALFVLAANGLDASYCNHVQCDRAVQWPIPTCMVAFSSANSDSSDRFVTGESSPTAATRVGVARAAYCAARKPPRDIPAINTPSVLARLCLARYDTISSSRRCDCSTKSMPRSIRHRHPIIPPAGSPGKSCFPWEGRSNDAHALRADRP